jgi:two-component system chemotaxis sensor kinase CheA
MKPADLLDQFVIEARECLEAIGKRLLDVEQDPANEELLNDLFRSVHTLKGNCGLFEFKPLERVVHAAEDLLDRVRHHTLGYGAELADALLEAMDYSAQLIDQIERDGLIEDGADARSIAHATALRSFVGDDAPGSSPMRLIDPPGVAKDSNSDVDLPWMTRLDPAAAASGPGRLMLRYLPEAGCFFKGEDPWRLARTVPGLLQLHVVGASAWPQGGERAAWDCYQCNLDIVLSTDAPRAEVEAHFRCVAEQVVWREATAPACAATLPRDGAVPPRLRQRAVALWNDQCELLRRAGDVAGSVRAARSSLAHLLACLDGAAAADASATLAALPEQTSAASLLAWACGNAPAGGAVTMVAGPAGTRGPDQDVASPALRADEGAHVHGQKVLKVGQEKIDRLMELIGEIVVAKNSLPYLAQRAEEVFQQRELAREIKAQYAVINRIADDLQHAIMQVRMLPVGAVFQRFGRLVRDISRKLGKEVNLVVEGEETEADKNVIESLADPLIHILRNSLDHGIELPEVRRAAGKPPAGTIRILARQENDRVVIEIRDDGAGVDAARVRGKAVEKGLIPADRAATLSDEEAVQLIFLPGFSTADQISDLSGRGVGMDVVRTAIERINGGVELSSVLGQGTTLRLSLPLSMAVTTVMVVESAGRRLGVPMDVIVETVRVPADDIHHFKQARTTVLRGRVVPLRALNDLLALDAEPLPNEAGELAVLVIRQGNESVGLLVDHFQGASDIILKPLEGVLAGLVGFAGTALMGDGGVLMVLNPKELLQ